MPTILADADVQGQVDYLVRLMKTDSWSGFWDQLSMRLATFADVGLGRDSSDRDIWTACQDRRMVLITANRNEDGPESLQTVIRTHNTSTSLPVLTLADALRIMNSRDYAEMVVQSIFDHMMRLDDLLGTGRLFVPPTAGRP